MIKAFEFRTREDGVKLFRTLDTVVNENGEPVFEEKEVTDAHGNIVTVKEPVSTGFKIHKVGTDEYYDDAIDVEGAPFVYEETDIPIEKPEEPIEEVEEIQ